MVALSHPLTADQSVAHISGQAGAHRPLPVGVIEAGLTLRVNSARIGLAQVS